MSRWIKPDVYPLIAAMSFVTGMCIFQLTRNVLMNPDVRINKAHRATAVLDNYEEGEKYAEHGFRKFLRTRSPEVMPTINGFFSNPKNND
ncbi:Polyphosphate kinase 1 [Bienertia sinuspersici]